MNRISRVFLSAFAFAFLFVPSNYATDSNKSGEAGALEVEINREGMDPVGVPALSGPPGRYTVIPAPEGSNARKAEARVFGVKVAPRMEGGAVRISLSILSGKFDEVTSCEQIKALQEEPASTYLVRKGESVRVTQFEGLGIQPFEVKVVSASGDGGGNNIQQLRCCRCQGRPDCCVPEGQDCKRCSPHCICCVA